MSEATFFRMVQAIIESFDVVGTLWIFPQALGGEHAFHWQSVNSPLSLSPMEFYILADFTDRALVQAGIEPKLYHIFGGRYSTRIVDGKELLGIEEMYGRMCKRSWSAGRAGERARAPCGSISNSFSILCS